MLREQLEKYSRESTAKESILYNGLTFDEMCGVLKNELIGRHKTQIQKERLNAIKCIFGDNAISILHLLWLFRDDLLNGVVFGQIREYDDYFYKLRGYGLIEYSVIIGSKPPAFTDEGRKFLMRLMIEMKEIGRGL